MNTLQFLQFVGHPVAPSTLQEDRPGTTARDNRYKSTANRTYVLLRNRKLLQGTVKNSKQELRTYVLLRNRKLFLGNVKNNKQEEVTYRYSKKTANRNLEHTYYSETGNCSSIRTTQKQNKNSKYELRTLVRP